MYDVSYSGSFNEDIYTWHSICDPVPRAASCHEKSPTNMSQAGKNKRYKVLPTCCGFSNQERQRRHVGLEEITGIVWR